jgi:hypothetical protein
MTAPVPRPSPSALTAHLAAALAAAAAAQGVTPATLAMRAAGDARLARRLAAGGTCRLTTWWRATCWLADHWPEGAAWPDGVPRPGRVAR